ncbi:MAG TPA: serine hydrolase [Catalimonadaceae bacterium]|nr:serine hydrolase [Catalimonadaceae bacterium]
MIRQILLFLSILVLLAFDARSQNLYFPPNNNNLPWDTLSPQSLGWCTNKTDSLFQYLQQENSKAFIVLKDGKIVIEKYFGSFTQDSIWYWASAGKTITSFLIGKAQEDGILSLADSSSRFLGPGWTSEPPEKERKITIRNQLTMTTGLNDNVPDNHCTIDTCLQYLADAGNRWAYHNAPYTLLEKVLTNASGQAINTYTQTKLKTPTGITGIWLTSDYDNVFYSKPRSMARFGLLALNKFNWNGNALLTDTAFINQSTRTSQTFNPSYGYLWWLNGKSSFMAPTSQFVFPGSYAPEAPADMFAAIGKNGQIICVVPSKKLVVVRMGNASSILEVPFLLCNEIWKRLNPVICEPTQTETTGLRPEIKLFPNPATEELMVSGLPSTASVLEIRDVQGKIVFQQSGVFTDGFRIETGNWPSGLYVLRISEGEHIRTFRFVK